MAIEYTKEVLEQQYMTPDGTAGPTREFYKKFSNNEELGWWSNVRDKKLPPGVAKTARVLVVGCGFGFLIEKLLAAGFSNVWGIDPCPYYYEPAQAHNFAPGVRARVGAYDVRPNLANSLTQTARRTLTGSNTLFDLIITEAVMESYAPAEQAAMYTACEAQRAASNRPIVHLVWDGWDGTPWGGCPARTLEEWQASRPGHTFVSLIGMDGGG